MTELREVDIVSCEYGKDETEAAVALIAGFGEGLDVLDEGGERLARLGYNVIGYAYSKEVFLSGDPSLIPAVTEAIEADFNNRTRDYELRREAGFSLGAGMAWNIQKHRGEEAWPGMYAAGGIDVANLVMNNLIFRGIVRHFHGVDPRKAFAQRGYSEEDLRVVWSELQEPPKTGFALALGSWDPVVRQKEIFANVQQWVAEGIDVRVFLKQRFHHDKINKWFLQNIVEMHNLADQIYYDQDSTSL